MIRQPVVGPGEPTVELKGAVRRLLGPSARPWRSAAEPPRHSRQRGCILAPSGTGTGSGDRSSTNSSGTGTGDGGSSSSEPSRMDREQEQGVEAGHPGAPHGQEQSVRAAQLGTPPEQNQEQDRGVEAVHP
ncbi:hypothetical protein AMECASPLE_027262 [Ameca splendens]|uniref:Uncharacterized protein n=1 Tax=Ameca splendens TaxID=208324 RepID=A0ABV1A1L1_9TELE